MARENDLEWREDVYKAAELWRDKCFLDDTALFNDKAIWTEPNLREIQRRIIDNADYSDKNFWDKLRLQLEGGNDDNYQLVAEIMWLIYLFPLGQKIEGVRTSVTAKTKLQKIKEVLSWGGLPVPTGQIVSTPALSGIGRVGRFYKHYFYAIEFLLEIMIAWKQLPAQRQQELTAPDSAWQFASWCDSFPQNQKVPMRHAFLFFLYPDYFERMVSEGHKDECPNHFKVLLSDTTTRHPSTPLETDKALYEIRQKLELIYPNDIVDFYLEPIQKDGHWINANDAFEEYKKAGQAPISPNTNRQSAHHQPAPATTGDTSSDMKSDIDALRPEELKEKGHTKQTEGERKLVKHYVRERAPKLRKAKLGAMIKKYDHLKCECCDTIGDTYKPEVRRSVFEVHHKKPLSEGMTINGLDDLALLCANCHRAIHATNPLLSVEEFKNSIT